MKSRGNMTILTPPDEGLGSFGVTMRGIFLAGPTPRSSGVPSWRPEALDILGSLGFDGFVLVPERDDWAVKFDYVDQVEWELEGLDRCAVVAFWVPRDMAAMPALTTNVEFGMLVRNGIGKVLYGRPKGAPHTGYLDHLYRKYVLKEPHADLAGMLGEAVREVCHG